MPPLQNKVRRLYFIYCKFYVAEGLSQKNRSYLRTIQPQHRSNNCFYYTPFGALRCKYHITKDGETDTR